MPYPPDHKAKTRARIVRSARALFNRHGFAEVTIDQVMARAGLTRGGFYHHFGSKEALFVEAVASASGTSPFSRALADGKERDPRTVARLFVDLYLADEMLEHVEEQCPLYALASDVSRASRPARDAYGRMVERIAGVFRRALPPTEHEAALAAVALCVGAMLLARTTRDPGLADHVRRAARDLSHSLLGRSTPRRRRTR